MARKNIFEIINEKRDLSQEIDRLQRLLDNEKGVKVLHSDFPSVSPHVSYYDIETYVDKFAFKKWPGRGTCVDLDDLAETINLNDILDSDNPTEDQIITFLEYVANVLFLVGQESNEGNCYKTDVVTAAVTNLSSFLDWLHLDQKIFEKKQQVLIVPKNAAATAVAEIVNNDLAYLIVKYNHHALSGDIEEKKSILLALGAELEPKGKILAATNKALKENIFFMLNNLNIRHNNRSKSSNSYKEYVTKMRKPKLEAWYDELYQMMLLAFLELDQLERNTKIDELKALVTGGQG